MSNITPTYNGAIPAFPQALSVDIEFTGSPYLIDLSTNLMQGKINGVQTVYIDAIAANVDIELIMLDTKQRITAKAGTQGYYPVLASQLMKFETKASGNAKYNIIFINFPIAVGVWGAKQSGGGGGTDYTLPTASDKILGGVKVGHTMQIASDGTLDLAGLPVASTDQAGVILVGDGLEMSPDGYLNVIPNGGGGGEVPEELKLLNNIFNFQFASDLPLNIPQYNADEPLHLINLADANFNGSVKTIGENFYYIGENNILFGISAKGFYELTYTIETDITQEGLNIFQLKKVNLMNDEVEQVFSTSQSVLDVTHPIFYDPSAQSGLTGMRTASFIFEHNDSDYGYGINIQFSSAALNIINGSISIRPVALYPNDAPE